MDIVKSALTWAFILVAVVGIALTLYKERNNLQFALDIWSRFRFGMFLQCLAIIILTIAFAVMLLQIPLLNISWISEIFPGGGNLYVRPIQEASKSNFEIVRLLPIAFFSAFLVAIPYLAKIEEDWFRKGYEDWRQIPLQSLKFGLMHCIMGVPLAVGIALTIGGLFFAFHYKRTYDKQVDKWGHELAQNEAVMVCTAYHAMYNTIILSFLLLGAVIAAI